MSWHYIEKGEVLKEKDNVDFYVYLKSGNRKVLYWDHGILRDVVSGQKVSVDNIKAWKEIEIPKDIN